MPRLIPGEKHSAACVETWRALDQADQAHDTRAMTGVLFRHLLAVVTASSHDAPHAWVSDKRHLGLMDSFIEARDQLEAITKTHKEVRANHSSSAIYGALFLHQMSRITESLKDPNFGPEPSRRWETVTPEEVSTQISPFKVMLVQAIVSDYTHARFQRRIEQMELLTNALADYMGSCPGWENKLEKQEDGMRLSNDSLTGPPCNLLIPLFEDEITIMEHLTRLTAESLKILPWTDSYRIVPVANGARHPEPNRTSHQGNVTRDTGAVNSDGASRAIDSTDAGTSAQ